ncbi:hypothetical protein [Paenibacillus sp. GCM10027626]|uniref:hypothetical protein n=1 Tax=Paenibacillus sp. GCM10027626 TaxID=3273411 RepID=UPI00362E62B3
MLNLRKATIIDHEFLVRIDLKNDGYTVSDEVEMTKQEKEEHIAMIMYSIANRDFLYPWKTIFNELDRKFFQSDGRFMEIFQLWVHPKEEQYCL